MKTMFHLLLAMMMSAAVLSHATSHSSAVGVGSGEHAALTEGEIRKIDKDGKKLTIRHGPIHNLDMPPMTMVFQVQDARVLDTLKPGDKVKFSAAKAGGAYTATHIEVAK